MAENTSLNERADALERKMSDELDVLLSKSALFNMADGKLGASNVGSDLAARHGKYSFNGRRSASAENAGEADARRFF